MRGRKKLALVAVSVVSTMIILTSCGGAGGGTPGSSAGEHPSIPDSSSSSSAPSESTSTSTSQPGDEKSYEATWSVGADGIPVLTKYTVHGEPPTGELVLPNEGTYKVGEWLFTKNQQITSVIIPEGVVEIENRAFLDCKNITKIVLSDTLKSIGMYAFVGTNVTSVELPEGLISVGYGAFRDCERLNKVFFPNTLKQIEEDAFANTGITEINLPTGLLSIGNYAFYGTKLTQVTVPEGVVSIGKCAFSCEKIEKIALPSTLEKIGASAFSDTRIITLRIPQSVKTIGDHAFSGNKYLESVTIEGPVKLEKNVFWDCSKLKDVKLNEGITEIPEGAFSYCWALSQIELPTELKVIGDSAFAETSLTSIKIPSKVTSIGENAFKHAQFETLVLPDGVSEISFEGLAYCSNLKKLYIPANVKKINRGAFEGCNNLTDIYYAGSESMWDSINVDATGNEVLSNATIHHNSSSMVLGLSSLFF